MQARIVLFILAVDCTLTQAVTAAKKKVPDSPPGMYSVPAAVLPGSTTSVTFFNGPDAAPTGLWTSFPAETAIDRSHDINGVRFSLKVPSDAPIGVFAVRVGTTSGASDLQLFMVDDLPSVPREGKNIEPRYAQWLTPPIAVDGACQSQAADYYRFKAARGQRLAFEVVAQRLGYRMDPVIRILDSTGHEIAYVDDTPGLGSDCRFACTFPSEGEYLLELHDAEYLGGTDRRYRLRIGDFPVVTVAFPPGAKKGTEASFAFEGMTGEHLGPVRLSVPATRPVGIKAEGGNSSAFMTILAGNTDEVVAISANHSKQTAAVIRVPGTISGRFIEKGQRDFYSFEGKKGQQLNVRGQTRSVGSPCDLLLGIMKPDGSSLAVSKPSNADEGLLNITIPVDGLYFLWAAELTGAAGLNIVYRLEVEHPLPGFSLSVDPLKLDGTAGGTLSLKVKCTRQNFDGPITLFLEGDGQSFELKNTVIGQGKKEVDLSIQLPSDLKAGRPLSFRVLGKATVNNIDRIETASTLEALKLLFPRLQFPPSEIDGLVGMGLRQP